MSKAFFKTIAAVFALTLLSVTVASRSANETGDSPEAGTIISNRAEATYEDPDGIGYRTVSGTVTVVVRNVAALVVTPDETEPSGTVSPNQQAVRLFRVCNTGNTPDFYTITRAEVSAPSQLSALFFDTDGSGTLTDGDQPITLLVTMSPRVARGECIGVLAVVEAGQSPPGTWITVGITARSNVTDSTNGVAEDSGTIINLVGEGVRIAAPQDPQLPPLKLVDGQSSTTAAFGQRLSYTINFRNHGDVTASNVALYDELPEGLDYDAGSLRLNGLALTDADDVDQGRVLGRRIEIFLNQVAPAELVQIAFQASAISIVAPGTGLVNEAMVSASNFPAVTSTAATVIVNPFGVVYQGRSGSHAPIPGATVRLLAESSTGDMVPLQSDKGLIPNHLNQNPFSTDGLGRWNFGLAPEQLGLPQLGARYYVNATAPGFRTRMLEVSVVPGITAETFTLVVRALDGEPLARSGGFDLTDDAVSAEGLAAFAFNIPMFETSALELLKSTDRPSAEIGDVITYRIEVHNGTAGTLFDVAIRDVPPPSFNFAPGSARLDVPPDATQMIQPQTVAGELIFRIPELRAGARATLTYRMRIGVNAREGDQVNSASATAYIGLGGEGESISTTPVRASVRVRRGVFSTQQIIIGRVFEDVNGNGQFDSGDLPVSGVRLYLNNGQSVITDSAGLYNFPSVNDGAHVIALDPLTLPAGFQLVSGDRQEERTLTRLLRTPLGGGAILRQNFGLRRISNDGSPTEKSNVAPGFAPEDGSRSLTYEAPTAPKSSTEISGPNSTVKSDPAQKSTIERRRLSVPATSGVYEIPVTDAVEAITAGSVTIVSPEPNEVIASAALEVEAQVAAGWTVELEVEGARIGDSKIGARTIDNKNKIATFVFVGINLRPGPNRIKARAIGPNGVPGQTVETVVFGRGPAKRLEIVTEKNQLSAGGRDSTTVFLRAYDQWGHPAADASAAVQVSAGRLAGAETLDQRTDNNASAIALDQASENASQRVVSLVNGVGALLLISDNSVGAAQLHATTGSVEARKEIRITAELRPAILVGLAEVSIGNASPEMALRNDDSNVQSRVAFFYRNTFFRRNLLTLSYDSQRPINRTAGNDRLFQLDPLERAYPIFGDSSIRYEDAQSNSKLYARIDRGRSYALFGDYDTELTNLNLAGYSRRMTGVKLHLENSNGDLISLTGARPDTAFARDVFPAGTLSLLRLSHTEILPGSEVVVLETRDRRNPEIILSREQLVRSIDYNLDPRTGDIFFLRFVSPFDSLLNLVQVVVTYEYLANNMSFAVYTGRAVKTFDRWGLRLGVSVVNQRQDEFGAFVLGGLDGEKKLPSGGTLKFEWATSRGRLVAGGNLFQDNGEVRHDGNAVRLQLTQPLGYKEGNLKAEFSRADEGFINPFGASITPGSQRATVSLDLKVRPSSTVRFGFTDERNRTVNVNNQRFTGSFGWSQVINERLRASFGYDYRRLTDNLSGEETDSNLISVGAEWLVTDKLQVSVKREQNLGDADPTYPDQTTIAANYRWNAWTRIFLTQRLASAPIVPISDASLTGFASTSSRRETAIGVETRLGKYTNLNSRYQLENGINGTDSFAVIGLINRLPLTEALSLDFSYERGFHLAGAADSFNALAVGFGWTPTQNFRTTGRYELRDRGGLGSMLTLGAAGRLADNLTMLTRFQASRINFADRQSSSLNLTGAIAWRPLNSDRVGLLFSYTRRDISHEGGSGSETRDRSDVLSSDAYWQATKHVELYGRFALKFADSGTQDFARVSSLTYLMQGRAAYRFGRYFDVAGEMRMLAQPSSNSGRTSFGSELGFWVFPDLRVAGGYNLTSVSEPGVILNGRRGFYFVISSKLSNLFDLFGSSRDGTDDKSAGSRPSQSSSTETPSN